MTTESRFDSVGWIFFGVVWLLSLAPTYYLMSLLTVDTTPVRFLVGTTAFVAGFGTAILTWIVNSLLGYIAEQRAARTGTNAPRKDRSEEE